MSTSGYDAESQTNPRRLLPVLSRKWKIGLTAALLLGAVAAVGLCVAVLGATNTFSSSSDESRISRDTGDTEPDEELQNELVRSRRVPPRPAVGERAVDPCVSEVSNHTIPAAHIKAHGMNWGPEQRVGSSKYPTDFDCSGSPAFVAGGMTYQPLAKSLYVPVCGYYHITSQVLFQTNSTSYQQNYLYTLNMDRNCENSIDNMVSLKGYVSIGPTSTKHTKYLRSTTSVGDTIFLCQHGRVWIKIPSGNPCCPIGDEASTFFAVHLVSEADCE